MKIVFFGNTIYSVIGARIIHEQLGLSQIVTIPDREDKRGHLTPSPLKTFALEKNIPVLTVNKLNNATIEHIASLQPDFLVVEDYGLILPQNLLALPKYASLNIHHSLLPKYRGPSPAPAAILSGETKTGVTVMKMAKKVDAGDILSQKEYIMRPDETTDSLLTVLNELGAHLIIPLLKKNHTMQATPQDETQATFTKMLTKQDGLIDSANPPSPEQLDRMIRAYYPWPTVWTHLTINGKEKIVKLLPEKKLQVEGKTPMGIKDFLNGYPTLQKVIKDIFHE